MSDERICLNCRLPFHVKRNAANRNAMIRYCDACKEEFRRAGLAERAGGGIINRLGRRNTRAHLART